jgi:hypothetical protein
MKYFKFLLKNVDKLLAGLVQQEVNVVFSYHMFQPQTQSQAGLYL